LINALWLIDHVCYDGSLHGGGRLFMNLAPKLESHGVQIHPYFLRSSTEVEDVFAEMKNRPVGDWKNALNQFVIQYDSQLNLQSWTGAYTLKCTLSRLDQFMEESLLKSNVGRNQPSETTVS